MTDLLSGRCRVTMWTVKDNQPQGDDQILGEMSWELFREQITAAGGEQRDDGTWQHIHAGTIYRYRAVDAAG